MYYGKARSEEHSQISHVHIRYCKQLRLTKPCDRLVELSIKPPCIPPIKTELTRIKWDGGAGNHI